VCSSFLVGGEPLVGVWGLGGGVVGLGFGEGWEGLVAEVLCQTGGCSEKSSWFEGRGV